MNNSEQNTQEPKSEVTEAVENADVGQIEDNLKQNKSGNSPEQLSAEEKTPFIDTQARTDK